MQVSTLCLGTMMLGARGEPDHDTAVRIVHRALDAGINFIDTADFYSHGESEAIVGKALAGARRDDVILATKVHMPVGSPDGADRINPNMRGTRAAGSSPRSRTACADSAATGSTSTRYTGRTRTQTSRKPSPY
jgi:aryl-alcohol dehydrogenase-like predicted oxidoreductase